MARARIHIICGNCGCNDEWSWKIVKDGVDLDGENFEDNVYLICGNCATIHSLWNIMPKEDCKPKITAQTLEPQITLEDARKSYADFMKIDEKSLMLLNEDESAFYFLHCKKDSCWKTSVSKKECDLFRALDNLTEKEIESYNKWLTKQA